MDAGSSGRNTRCNVGRQWSRGGQVMPRLGNRSDTQSSDEASFGLRVSWRWGWRGFTPSLSLHRLRRGSDRSRSPATRVTGRRRFCDDDQPWEPGGQGVSEPTVLDSPTGEVTQLGPSSRESTTSDTVRVSPALNAVETGRSEQENAGPRVASHHCRGAISGDC